MLEALSIFKNNITHIPPENGQLPPLPGVALYENKSQELPREMGNMSSLMEL